MIVCKAGLYVVGERESVRCRVLKEVLLGGEMMNRMLICIQY